VSKILRLALHDLRLTTRDRASFIWLLLLPLAMMWFFGNIGYGDGATRPARVTVVDLDGGWLARAFVADLGADEQINVRELTAEQAQAAADKVRTLYIPAGFTAGVLAGEQQTLRLEKDPETSEDFALAVEARVVRIVVRTIGRLIEIRQADVPQAGDAVAARFAALGERPPLVALSVASAGRGRPVPTGRAQSVPGILTMSVMMMTLIYGAVFLTLEKQTGTLRRQLTLPLSRRHVILGKLAGRVLLAVVQTAILLAAGRLLYGVPLGGSPTGLALLALSYCLAVAGLATLLGAVLRTPEQASAIGWILGMILAALGGCWWPAEIMPRWLVQATHVLPTAWAMDGFHALISFGYGLESVIVPSLALLAFATVFSLLGARWLRTAGGGA
jgi:ABC-type multidrug transport system permease subunit